MPYGKRCPSGQQNGLLGLFALVALWALRDISIKFLRQKSLSQLPPGYAVLPLAQEGESFTRHCPYASASRVACDNGSFSSPKECRQASTKPRREFTCATRDQPHMSSPITLLYFFYFGQKQLHFNFKNSLFRANLKLKCSCNVLSIKCLSAKCKISEILGLFCIALNC